ncbi:MAG: helix-turn-helix domain-containing protein [Spongiibacteraceae bacterium]|jgi:transcriptional regulator GlxA family with amidase domain|nr:helix-turn-helix domain-containing protein [Spongiibacteraceae bacterium]
MAAILVDIVAVPETAGSALYGLVDVLSATGSVWQTLARLGEERRVFEPRIVSPHRKPFRCGFGIPVQPKCHLDEARNAGIVILPELWLGPDEAWRDRYPQLLSWIRQRHQQGAFIYSACSGAVMLAATGLLDGRDATSHWGYQQLFRRDFPEVHFHPEPNLCFADRDGRIVTAGGTTSWHDLALHIIARHCSPAEAVRIAKVYLLKWHSEGQLPYTPLVRPLAHGDAVVTDCEQWLKSHFTEPALICAVVARSGMPERTLKRRFKAMTGMSLIDYIQNLRIEESKRLLESSRTAVDDISAAVGYEEAAFFRRLFKRRTNLTPGEYRRLFRHIPRDVSPTRTRGMIR